MIREFCINFFNEMKIRKYFYDFLRNVLKIYLILNVGFLSFLFCLKRLSRNYLK